MYWSISMSIKCIETKTIQNPEVLSKVIYNNFKYLIQFPELGHDVKTIVNTLKLEGNVCYLVYCNAKGEERTEVHSSPKPWDGRRTNSSPPSQGKLIAYLVGDFRVLADKRYVYYVSYMYVVSEYRNKKIGSKLMDMLIKKCMMNGTKFILLTYDSDDKKVERFYKRYGFVDDRLLGSKARHRVVCKYL